MIKIKIVILCAVVVAVVAAVVVAVVMIGKKPPSPATPSPSILTIKQEKALITTETDWDSSKLTKEQYCSVEVTSLQGVLYPTGCSGAVDSSGYASPYYCIGQDNPDIKHIWYKNCCEFDAGVGLAPQRCVPTSP